MAAMTTLAGMLEANKHLYLRQAAHATMCERALEQGILQHIGGALAGRWPKHLLKPENTTPVNS